MRADTVEDQLKPPLIRAIRVALVDDQVLVRSGFRMMIDAEPDIDVVGEASNGAEALTLMRQTPIDILLMDVRMPGMDGIETTRKIISAGYPVKIIILTTFDLDDYVYQALRAGASGFLLKDARATELVDAIRAVNSGDAIMAPSTTKRLLSNLVPGVDRSRPDPRLNLLTDREIDVLKEIAIGRNNMEIAERLHLAEGTVKTHISRLLFKLQARDRVGLVLAAYDMGVVER
ncbi:MAG: response regulator transcription factor [Propionibacteriaceae bacterium]|jgi:DNA-binding NarL/FixJ family response regulator|nr:response regulator transcription factor [Propionibacteriaceae bacterium]